MKLLPIIIVVVLITIGVFYLQSSQKKAATSPQTSSITTQSSQSSSLQLDPSAQSKAQSDYQQKVEQSGFKVTPQPDYSFTYKLAPGLGKKQSFLMNALTKVLGATSCDVSNLSTSLPVYQLKNLWNEEDAKAVAEDYGISEAKTSSFPEKDGTFEYLFSNPETNGYLSLYASSGVYNYHRVLDKTGADISFDLAKSRAQDTLKLHKLDENLSLLDSSSSNGDYLLRYTKSWDQFKMTDLGSLITVAGGSVCNVQPTENSNIVEVHYTKDGQLSRVLNFTRKETNKQTLPKQELEDALKEYETSADLPVKPIVLPEGTSIKEGEIELTEATVVWFDQGYILPQKIYVPFYLTKGTIKKSSETATIYSLFPAVSSKELVKAGLVPEGSNKRTLQIDVFVPKPPSVGFSCPPGVKSCCPGKLVDYGVSCTKDGVVVCTLAFSIPEDQDKNNVCKDGTFSKDGVINNSAGSNPCRQFLKDNKVPNGISGPYEDENLYQPNSSMPAGPVSCQLSGAPC